LRGLEGLASKHKDYFVCGARCESGLSWRTKCSGRDPHGYHRYTVCGLLRRITFWLRTAGFNLANSKTESTPDPAVSQLHGKASFEPAAFSRGGASKSTYQWVSDPQFTASRASLHACCKLASSRSVRACSQLRSPGTARSSLGVQHWLHRLTPQEPRRSASRLTAFEFPNNGCWKYCFWSRSKRHRPIFWNV